MIIIVIIIISIISIFIIVIIIIIIIRSIIIIIIIIVIIIIIIIVIIIVINIIIIIIISIINATAEKGSHRYPSQLWTRYGRDRVMALGMCSPTTSPPALPTPHLPHSFTSRDSGPEFGLRLYYVTTALTQVSWLYQTNASFWTG